MTTDTAAAETFRAFAMAGMSLGATMLDTLRPEQHSTIDRAIQAGARLSLELLPLPAFDRAQLVLTEAEGARHVIVVLTTNKGPLQ